jgi:hypothetical protein
MDLGMQAWLDRLFGETDKEGTDRLMEFDEFCPADDTTFARLAEVFENSSKWLAPYSEACVAQAFWDLGSTVFGELGRPPWIWERHARLFRSIEVLFREYFAVRCGPKPREGGPLSTVCYMWWDMDCWYSIPSEEFFAMLRAILAIDHPGCQESALHGLGHEHTGGQNDAEVEAIIDEFLARRPNLDAELREYALLARRGMVQ